MLPRSATKTVTLTTDDGQVITPSNGGITFDTLIGADLNIPPCITLKEYTLTIPVISAVSGLNILQMFAMGLFKVDGDPGLEGEVTVQFNAGPSPSPETFTVSIDNGLCWIKGDVEDAPINYNVTTIWITNTNTSNMVLQIRAGVNATVYQ